MKRILIVNNNMHIGGVQKALLDLLKEISSEYEITLLLFYAGGELINEIPHNVHVIEASGLLRQWGMTRYDTKGILSAAARLTGVFVTRMLGRKWGLKMPLAFQHILCGYDVAISFLHCGAPHVFYGGCSEFVLRCTEAAKKVVFLHCDYRKIHADCAYNTGIYQKFDQIAACSEGCRQAFLEVLPALSEKTAVVHNCLNYADIRQKARLGMVTLEHDKLNILTVSRFSKEKGILRGIHAIASLGQQRKKLRYYIIGEGSEFCAAAALISELSLQDTVFLLGKMDNPYGYMADADILLIPSVSEAAPLVIGEAACLGTPILATRTLSVDEMIVKPGYGWICENSCEGISRGLYEILINPKILEECASAMENCCFSNEMALKEIKAVIGLP